MNFKKKIESRVNTIPDRNGWTQKDYLLQTRGTLNSLINEFHELVGIANEMRETLEMHNKLIYRFIVKGKLTYDELDKILDDPDFNLQLQTKEQTEDILRRCPHDFKYNHSENNREIYICKYCGKQDESSINAFYDREGNAIGEFYKERHED